MDAETVVERVQGDAAATVASEVSATVIGTAITTQGDVAQVSEQLAEHAESSEERHEEILEETWDVQENITSLQASQTMLQTQLTLLSTQLTQILQLLTPPTPTPPIPDSMLSIPPVSAVIVEESPDESPEPLTVPEKRRRVRTI